MPITKKNRPSTTKQARARRSAPKAIKLTAAYVVDRSDVSPHRVFVDVLEAEGVFTEGKTIDVARANLHKLVPIMLGEAPGQFRKKARPVPPGALCETFFVLLT